MLHTKFNANGNLHAGHGMLNRIDICPAMRVTSRSAGQVRVRSTEQTRNYVSHALGLLREKEFRTVVLKAMGKAINKTVAIGKPARRGCPSIDLRRSLVAS
jgi:hypothetical protein